MNNILQAFVQTSIYASAMIIAALTLGKLFSGKISAKVMHILWLVVLLRLLLPVTFETPVGLPYPAVLGKPFSVAQATGEKLPEAKEEADVYTDSLEIEYPSSAVVSENTSVSEAAPLRPSAFKLDVSTIAFSVWLVGAALFLAVNLFRIIAFRRKIKRSISSDIRYEINLGYAKNLLGIKRKVRIAEADCAGIPFVYGCFKPAIVMPRGFLLSICDEKISYIILHELCHVKRHDLVLNCIWLLARALHWFNPLVHLAYKSYLGVIEEACDEMAAKHLEEGGRCEYVQSMLDAARLVKSNKKPLISVALFNGTSALKRRVMRLMHPKKKSRTMLFATILISCVMVFACFTTACMPEEAGPEQIPKEAKIETDKPEKSPSTFASNDAVEPEEIITKMDSPEMKAYFMFHTENYYGDYLCYFKPKDTEIESLGVVSYLFLRSDKSLLGYYSHKTDLSMPLQFTETEFREKALKYIKKIWGYKDIETISSQVSEDIMSSGEKYFYEFTGKSSSDERMVYINLDGNGDLNEAKSYPKMDLSKGVTMDEAYEIALSEIRRDAHITDADRLKIINKSIKNYNPLYPVYHFDIYYGAENPSASEFDYSCQIDINSSNGELSGMALRPYVYNNPDLILPNDAEQMAKEHIAEVYYGSLDMCNRLTRTDFFIDAYKGTVNYCFFFDYSPKESGDTQTEYSYQFWMHATGEFTDIAKSLIDD